tara:strand:- start:51 stop:596 length:546 start_codon:yes stop_codon:yes gene_type:complete
MSLNVTLASEIGDDNRVHIGQAESILFDIVGGVQRVQWRTWDMRDNWMDLAEFNVGDEQFEVTHSLLVDRLRFLPNNTVEGDQVILVRAISGDEASTNLAVGIHIMGDEKVTSSDSDNSLIGIVVGILALLVLMLLSALIFAGLQLRKQGYFDSDEGYYEETEFATESMMDDDAEAAPYGD